MEVTFIRHVNQQGKVRWSCEIDGLPVTGSAGNFSYGSKSYESKGKPALCEMRDFLNFIGYISDQDFQDTWEKR